MRCTVYAPQETFPMPLTLFRSRKFISRRHPLFGLFLVTVVCANTTAVLAAQQAESNNSRPVVLAASTAEDPTPNSAPQSTAAPAPDSASEAAAHPAQSPSTDAPAPQNQPAQNAQGDSSGQQTKRILGIIPNFRAVSANTKLPPESVKEKFVSATEDSFDYSAIFIPAAIAAYDMGKSETPEFHQGAAGYARYFWHSAVDQTNENYMVEFIFPTVTREDSRYYTLGHGGFVKRTGYALSRAVITRSNSGTEVFNLSEVLGAGAASGISNLYYPSASRSLGNTGSQWGLDVAIDAASFWFKEFWPDINRRLFHNEYSEPPAAQ
jgi:hypothetical protein